MKQSLHASDNTSSIVRRCFRAEQLCSWHLLHRQLTFDPGFITHVRALDLALCPGSLKDMLQSVCLILLLFDNPNSQEGLNISELNYMDVLLPQSQFERDSSMMTGLSLAIMAAEAPGFHP